MTLQTVLGAIAPYAPIIIGVIVLLAFLLTTVKVVTGNEVLVVTGVGATKKDTCEVKQPNGEMEKQVVYVPKIRIAGASFVIPVIQRARKFDICVEKADKYDDTMKTKTGVEIVLDWGISYAPNADSVETLQPCIRQFLDKDKHEIEEIIKSVVAGGMRAVISTMTPQDVMVGKETLDEKVQANISEQMEGLGYKVQIYIQEVRDAEDSTYYNDLAAEDRETRRRDAAKFTADAQREIREKEAIADQQATETELESEVAIESKRRDTAVKKAAFKAETDRANADAAIAGELQATERQRELAEKEGQVEVMRQEQNNLAAQKEQTVAVTRAETAKREQVIATEAEAATKKLQAEADAAVAKQAAEGRAEAAKASANGEAEAKKTRAAADAEAVRLNADAEAEKTRKIGEAEATAISAKGKAEAEAIAAKGKAEAEAARALSDAQAANDKVNFEIAKLEIERDTKIQIATNVASAMASVGEKATFYDLNGGGSGDGDLLTRVLGNIPTLMKKANLENEALNGETVDETVNTMMQALVGPLSALAEKKQTVVTGTDKETVVVQETGGSSNSPAVPVDNEETNI